MKKYITILLTVIVLFTVYNIFSIYRFNNITYNEYKNLNTNNQTIIYIYDTNTSSNKTYTDIIKSVMKNYKTKIYSLNYNKLTNKEQLELINNNEILKKEDSVVVPLIMIKEKKDTSILMGTTTKEQLEDFIKENGVK